MRLFNNFIILAIIEYLNEILRDKYASNVNYNKQKSSFRRIIKLN